MTSDDKELAERPRSEVAAGDDLPVVARLVIEVRSDGSRTIARGAIEDLTTGESTAIEAKGTTPLALATTLARSLAGELLKLPLAARGVLAALVTRRND